MGKNITKILLSLLILYLLCCQKELLAQAKHASLKAAATFKVGVAINPRKLFGNERYKQTVVNDFSSITAENAMKVRAMHPEKNIYSWQVADSLATFAAQNNIRLHGHTLVWHEALPQWITDFKGDSAAWEGIFKDHIQTIAKHFKGKVASWDVVNEAIADTTGHWRKTLWQQKLGNNYVARAFRYAHEADPGAKLFYNEYGLEKDSVKLTAVVKMLAELKQQGVPIHGLGLQMHFALDDNNDHIKRMLVAARQTGLLVHISEADLRINPNKSDSLMVLTPELLNAQKEKYKFMVQAYRREIPTKQQFGITMWNLSDKDTWVRKFFKKDDYPTLFDKDLNPKPAYQGFLEGLK